MNKQAIIANQFRVYMNSNSSTNSSNLFESLVKCISDYVNLGQPFVVASLGFSLQEYCKEDVDDVNFIESLLREELDSRNLSEMYMAEQEDPIAIEPGSYVIQGEKVVIESELLPCDEFFGYAIYKHNGLIFTIEEVQKEDAPVNSVGGGHIAGASPGQEPPGRPKMGYIRRNLKKTKQLKRKLL